MLLLARGRCAELGRQVRVKRPAEPDSFHTQHGELRIHFDQTRVNDCYNRQRLTEMVLVHFVCLLSLNDVCFTEIASQLKLVLVWYKE